MEEWTPETLLGFGVRDAETQAKILRGIGQLQLAHKGKQGRVNNPRELKWRPLWVAEE